MTTGLPFDCPRGLSRIEAARYVGVCTGTFDKMVEDGRMPKPKKVGRRKIYDRDALNLAFSTLPEGGDPKNDFDEDV